MAGCGAYDRPGMRPLLHSCNEQDKLPTAKAFKLVERDKCMSEQKSNYMAQLNAWSNEHVIAPLLDYGVEAIEGVQKAIREKVLESYKNGLKAGAAKPARKEPRR